MEEFLKRIKSFTFGLLTEIPEDHYAIILLFEMLADGELAMEHIRTWRKPTIAFVQNTNSAIDFYLFDDDARWPTATKIMTLSSLDDIEGLREFLKFQKQDEAFYLWYGLWTETNLLTTTSGSYIKIEQYAYTDNKSFMNYMNS